MIRPLPPFLVPPFLVPPFVVEQQISHNSDSPAPSSSPMWRITKIATKLIRTRTRAMTRSRSKSKKWNRNRLRIDGEH